MTKYFDGVLPRKFNTGNIKDFQDMGIIFGENVDEIFRKAILPEGWKIESTDHDMWFNLLDNQNRVRATMFYKVAAWDYDSFLNVKRRYNFYVEPINGWNENYKNVEWVVRVKDYDNEILWESNPTEKEPDVKTNRDAWLKWVEKKNDVLPLLAKRWLNNAYPSWEHPIAYWSE